ncbi:MAG: DUF1573 domain-containing protein [Clostridiales bacterium]|nr:DUF1573 domain-containing protein [Clostridiales bacterium]HBM80304.1 DUF1573 domain-containing protein [Clostridiaceae bacterium]
MKDLIFDDFQEQVAEILIRHKSIIDILTKLQEAEARLNRAVAKSVTTCGCLQIDAKKQCISCDMPKDVTFEELSNMMKSHLKGSLCDNCRNIIEKEMGNNIFYIVSLCNALGINLYDVFLEEYDRLKLLGKYDMR